MAGASGGGEEVSEFGWGRGLVPNPNTGYPLSAFDRLRATRLTDPANPNASEDDVYVKDAVRSGVDATGAWVPGTLRVGATPPVKTTAELPSSGQHARVYPDRYNVDHEPDGQQDGEGREWRNSVPPNPVI